MKSFIANILHHNLGEVAVQITSPLTGYEGEDLTIPCIAYDSSNNPVDPTAILLICDSVLFIDDRLTHSTNGTHKVFTLSGVSMSDAGKMVHCAIAGFVSPITPLEIYCE